MPDWRRQDAVGKGERHGTSHAKFEIIQQDPYCIMEFVISPSAKHWEDSHGSADRRKTAHHGMLVRWITDIQCSGTNLILFYETWYLIMGSNAECGTPAPPPQEIREWYRNNLPTGNNKGMLEYVLALPICKEGDPCEEKGLLGQPLCNDAKLIQDVTARAVAMSHDSHGNLDKVWSYVGVGPTTTVVLDATATQEDCPPPLCGIKWKVRKTVQTIQLHPGSVLVNAFQRVLACCTCCEPCSEGDCCRPSGCSEDDCCTTTGCCPPTVTLDCDDSQPDCGVGFLKCHLIFSNCCDNSIAHPEYPPESQPAGCAYAVDFHQCPDEP